MTITIPAPEISQILPDLTLEQWGALLGALLSWGPAGISFARGQVKKEMALDAAKGHSPTLNTYAAIAVLCWLVGPVRLAYLLGKVPLWLVDKTLLGVGRLLTLGLKPPAKTLEDWAREKEIAEKGEEKPKTADYYQEWAEYREKARKLLEEGKDVLVVDATSYSYPPPSLSVPQTHVIHLGSPKEKGQ